MIYDMIWEICKIEILDPDWRNINGFDRKFSDKPLVILTPYLPLSRIPSPPSYFCIFSTRGYSTVLIQFTWNMV